MTKRTIILGIVVLLALVMAGCAGAEGVAGPAGEAGPAGPAGPEGPAGADANETCTECHNGDTALFNASQQWALSMHATGSGWSYAGARGSCTYCHSHEGFAQWMAGVEEITAPAVPSTANCRTCHNIHDSYTAADWGLASGDPVALIAFEGVEFDGGKGNLCANCHQPRRQIAAADDNGMIEITSTHWGPHHGPQSAVLLGLGGAGEEAEGSAGAHSSMIEDACVACHMSKGDHNWVPDVAYCAECHADAESFDIGELQTEVEALGEELLHLLEEAGTYHDGHPVPGTYDAGVAQATWNYILVFPEDASNGVHNPSYIKALLEWSIAQFE